MLIIRVRVFTRMNILAITHILASGYLPGLIIPVITHIRVFARIIILEKLTGHFQSKQLQRIRVKEKIG